MSLWQARRGDGGQAEGAAGFVEGLEKTLDPIGRRFGERGHGDGCQLGQSHIGVCPVGGQRRGRPDGIGGGLQGVGEIRESSAAGDGGGAGQAVG